MKILFIIDNLCGGGAEKVLVDILNNISYEKYNIELFLIRNKGVYLDFIPHNVTVNYIYNDKKYENKFIYKLYYIMTKLHFKLNRIKGLKSIFKYNLKGKTFDIYISFLEGAPMQLIADSGLRGKKIAWIHTEMNKHNIMNRKKEKFVMQNMDKLVCVSQGAKKSLVEKYPYISKEIVVINNPIDITLIEKKSKEIVMDIKRGEIPVFIAIGRIEKVKGYDLLLEAHRRIIKEGLIHKVIIVGEGSERKYLEKLAREYGVEESFKFIGFKSNPYKYLKLADYYVMPSRYEGYPLSLCEAIALEKPIICSNFESANEILLDGNLGLIFKREDINDLVKSMKRLLIDKELVSRLKNNCGENKLTLSFKNNIKKIENILECK